MRIAILTHKVDFLDGQGRVNFEIAQAALKAGHSVTIFAEYCSSEIAQHPRGAFVRSRERSIPTQLLRNLHFAESSARWLRQNRHDFDIVQANGFVTWERADVVAVHFVHTAWLKNALFPFRWNSFSPYAYYQRVLAIINSRYERRAFAMASKLVAVSSFTAGEVIDTGVPPEKIVVVNNGVDTSEFCPGDSMRAEFSLPLAVPLALFVGDIKTTRKNLGSVLTSMQSVPELHLAVAGAVEGSSYPALASELGVADRVHFLGKTSRMVQLMRSADFFVFPSRYEAQPLVLLEAMASGLPVVVSNNFGAGSYVDGAGIVYGDSDDVVALTATLQELLASPEKLREMSVAARERALGMQWTRTAEGYLQVYEDLVSGKHSAGPHR